MPTRPSGRTFASWMPIRVQELPLWYIAYAMSRLMKCAILVSPFVIVIIGLSSYSFVLNVPATGISSPPDADPVSSPISAKSGANAAEIIGTVPVSFASEERDGYVWPGISDVGRAMVARS